jgi:predicted extracellular nuclease
VLSGAGAPDEDSWGSGETPSITDILDGEGGSTLTGAGAGGTDSSGTSNGGVEAQGGTASGTARGGAAAGGSAGKGGASGKAGAANGGNGSNAGAPAVTTLYFSEYVEGSSSNKALEITSSKRVSLDGCKVGTWFNGKAEPTVIASLSGTLDAGKVLTLCTSALAQKLGAVCQQVGNLTFNGDDAVGVSCNGQLLDVIGQVGVDPGEGWGSAQLGTLDLTLRRKCSVSAGDETETDAFDPSREWQAFPADTFDGLGARGCP